MKQPKSLFFRHTRKQDPVSVGVAILITCLLISNLAACTGQGVHTPTPQLGITVSPPQTLKLAGPDSGLYIASQQQAAVYKVDYRTGKVLWTSQFKLKHPSSFGPYALPTILLVQHGYVFIESQDGMVYALLAATGQLAWSYVFGNNVVLALGQYSPPVLDHGMLFIPGIEFLPDKTNPHVLSKLTQDLLYGFDAQTGKLLRTYPFVRAFTLLNQVLYASDLDEGTLRAINVKSGQVLWQVHQPGQIFLTPHVISGKVYVLMEEEPTDTYRSSLYAFNAATGQQVWRSGVMTAGRMNDLALINDLAISTTAIFYAETNGSLYAYDASNGHLRWRKAMHFVGNLLVEDNRIYATFNPDGVDLASADPPVPGLVILDATTGSLIWQKMIATPNAADSSPDTIISIRVHKSILFVTHSQYPPSTSTVEQTTTLDSSKKTLWQINVGGYDDVLVP
jgi:outer membrane protein assembly factor BamB